MIRRGKGSCIFFRLLRSKEGKLNELGCKDGGNVIFWLRHLEINVNAIKHFDDHSRIKKL